MSLDVNLAAETGFCNVPRNKNILLSNSTPFYSFYHQVTKMKCEEVYDFYTIFLKDGFIAQYNET